MDFNTVWTITINVLLVIIGFNALVIVHEFGHFAVARLCGVRCEKFYIWFDFWGLKFFKFKWGNTEYGLGLFPLGGYVKMLGQEDDPGKIREEIERAKAQEQGSEPPQQDSAISAASRSSSLFAPDSYLSKSVPQRLAIIVAGVAMNFIFAVICAAGAFMIGVKETAPVIGSTVAGSPAWQAGLQTGDRVLELDGSPARTYRDIQMKMIGGNRSVTLTVKRNEEEKEIAVSPRKREGELAPMIGILSCPSLELLKLKTGPVDPQQERFYDAESLKKLKANFRAENLSPVFVTKIKGTPVGTFAEYQDVLLKNLDEPQGEYDDPVTVSFSDGTEAVLPLVPMRQIPVFFRMGPIAAVMPGSDAEKKGIEPGDTLLAVDGIGAVLKEDGSSGPDRIDPLRLPQTILRRVNYQLMHNLPLSLFVDIRKKDGSRQHLEIELTPDRSLPGFSGTSMRDTVGSTALGLTWEVEPVIDGHLPPPKYKAEDAPANITLPETGDKVTGIEFLNCEPFFNKMSFCEKTETGFFLHGIGEKIGIPYIFTFLLQEVKPKEGKTLAVRLNLESADGKTKVLDLPVHYAAEYPNRWYRPDRGLLLQTQKTVVTAKNIGDALWLGTERMISDSFVIYRSLQALTTGTVSAKAMSGPVGIVWLLYYITSQGMSEYLLLLCLIGANLAVINILPIPPLDGGHVIFLLYEGLFRRAPNEWVQVILSYIGLFLILLLMVWTLSLDLACIPRW
ncbi:MAG: site-2 protease family protein [Planctomycetaceae bacterium]|jgi:regulator of sigma E protease|nr:site-2 protease family protein [Planctomycetaceae bacterium]